MFQCYNTIGRGSNLTCAEGSTYKKGKDIVLGRGQNYVFSLGVQYEGKNRLGGQQCLFSLNTSF